MDKGGIILIRGGIIMHFYSPRRFDGSQIHHFVYITASKRPVIGTLRQSKKSPCQSDIDRGTLMG